MVISSGLYNAKNQNFWISIYLEYKDFLHIVGALQLTIEMTCRLHSRHPHEQVLADHKPWIAFGSLRHTKLNKYSIHSTPTNLH